MRPVDPEIVAGAVADWETELAPVADEAQHTVAIGDDRRGGPAGTVLMTLAGDQVWVGGSRPHPGVLAEEGPVAEAVRKLYRSWPLPVVALRGADGDRAVDDTRRPRLTEHELRAADDDPIQVDPPFVVHQGRRAVLAYDSTTVIGERDPLSRLLYWLSSSLGWEFPAYGFPALPAERTTWKHLPRLVLPSGAVLSPRRWTIDGPAFEGVAAATGAEQYLAWRALADERGWPDKVAARWDPHPLDPALVVPASSPLAVRALWGACGSAPRLVVSEVPPPTVVGGDGSRYVAEAGVIWHDPGFWDTSP
jgi:hypothetical protein